MEKTLSVKTGILKQSANARVAMLPSMGILLIVKVGPDFFLGFGCLVANGTNLFNLLAHKAKKCFLGMLVCLCIPIIGTCR